MKLTKQIKKDNQNKRFIEIDVIKGIALISMVIFHFFYLGEIMKIKPYNTGSGILKYLAKFAHLTFIIISGLNLAISISYKKRKEYQLKKVKRGLLLIILGLIISITTKLEFGESYVKFGIMHFIGTATIISSLYANLPIISIFIAIIIFLLQGLLSLPEIRNSFYSICEKNPFTCFITGILNIKYNSIDHFSLIPYLGFFSMGIGLAYLLYDLKRKDKQRKRKFSWLSILDNYKDNIIIKKISWLGKNSLIIYFIHFFIFWVYWKLQQ